MGSCDRRLLGRGGDESWKVTLKLAGRSRGRAEVVELLPNKHKTLSANPSTTKKNQNQNISR
jgi:hypothetical protein